MGSLVSMGDTPLDVSEAKPASALDAPSAASTRALKKKIRQIKQLRARHAAGEDLGAPQLAKLTALAALEAELAALELASLESWVDVDHAFPSSAVSDGEPVMPDDPSAAPEGTM